MKFHFWLEQREKGCQQLPENLTKSSITAGTGLVSSNLIA